MHHIAVCISELAEVVAITLLALPLHLCNSSYGVASKNATGNLLAHSLTIGVEHIEGKALRVVVSRQHEAKCSTILDAYARSATVDKHLLRGISVER